MCGIFGVIQHNSDSIPHRQLLESSARLLEHRGPDNQGIFADKAIGLVHTRLSLLDLLPRSNQPFCDQSLRYQLVYNGEIYNFRDLRTRMEKDGIQFRTTSDTEVLLQSLIHYGPRETLKNIEGMYAFALYDSRDRSLVLARDKFGMKPLYTYSDADRFIFASEIAAMRPWVPFEPDLLSISSYVQGFFGPTKGASFYRNIKIVPPGTLITVARSHEPQTETFFEMSDLWDDDLYERLNRQKTEEVVDTVDEMLLNNVRMQLVADAPVGALCSGGVDSSTVMAMAARTHGNLAIFHANVLGPESEYDAAKALADHLRLDLKTVDVDDSHFIEMMPEVTRHYGHPFLRHTNSVPFLMVSQLVSENNVKAVLSGEGSDECYFGYPNMIPNTRRLLRAARRQWPTRSIGQFIQVFRGNLPTGEPLDSTSGLGNRFELHFENDRIRSRLEQISRRRVKAADLIGLSHLSYHLRTLLHRNDCLGMAAGIEARFPFLDSSLVRLAVNLPYRYKVRFSPLTRVRKHLYLRDKWIIRKIADRYLPRHLSQRMKMGFPAQAYYRMNISPDFFRNSHVSQILELTPDQMRHLYEHSDQKMKVRLLHLDVWAHVCLYNLPDGETIARMKDNITFNSQ